MDDSLANQSQKPPPMPQNPTPGGPQSVSPQTQSSEQVSQQQQAAQQQRSKGIFYSFWFWALIMFLLNSVAIFWFFVYPAISSRIVVKDQTITDRIRIDELRVAGKSALLIELKPDPGNPISDNIGSLARTGVLPTGTYKDFDLFLNEGVLSGVEPGKVFTLGTKLVATLYKDTNNNGIFETEVDTELVRNFYGTPVSVEFTIR